MISVGAEVVLLLELTTVEYEVMLVELVLVVDDSIVKEVVLVICG